MLRPNLFSLWISALFLLITVTSCTPEKDVQKTDSQNKVDPKNENPQQNLNKKEKLEQLLACVPSDASLVAVASPADILKNPDMKRFADLDYNTTADSGYNGFVKKVGFDPMQEIDWLILSAPDSIKTTGHRAYFAIGRFDQEKGEAYILDKGNLFGVAFNKKTVGSAIVYTHPSKATAIAFLQKDILLFGHKDWIALAIEAHKDKSKSIHSNQTLMTELMEIYDKGAIFGAGNVLDAFQSDMEDSPGMWANLAANIKEAKVFLDFSEGLNIEIHVVDKEGNAQKNQIEPLIKWRDGMVSDRFIKLIGYSKIFAKIKLTHSEDNKVGSATLQLSPEALQWLIDNTIMLLKS